MLGFLFFYSLFLIPSYFICKFIYRVILKSEKKISKFLVFIGSIGLFAFYYSPYSFYLEPSFWTFRSVCKFNDLPNNEDKYNKILAYYDTNLDEIDWKKVNERKVKLSWYDGYVQNVKEYASPAIVEKRLNYRSDSYVNIYSNEPIMNKNNITDMATVANWDTGRLFLEGNIFVSGLYWKERSVGCALVANKYGLTHLEKLKRWFDNDKLYL